MILTALIRSDYPIRKPRASGDDPVPSGQVAFEVG